MKKIYTIRRSAQPVRLDAPWDSAMWQGAETADLEYTFDQPTEFRPKVQVRMLHDDKNICGLFSVNDRYVVARAEKDQDSVCLDSCVEFFVHPAGDERYYNFEINCGGTLLLYHVKDIHTGEYEEVSPKGLQMVKRFHTMPKHIDPEITEPTQWYLGFSIPVEFFVKYSGISPKLSGQVWEGNFCKCADKCSHPCWLTWHEIHKDYHQPQSFGTFRFE